MASPQTQFQPGQSSTPIATTCTNCGVQAPTKPVHFYQNIGLLVMRQTREAQGVMCRRCIREYFVSYELTTLFLGWWGLISAVMTAGFLVMNLIEYCKSLGLPEPMAMGGPLPPSNVAAGQWGRGAKLAYGAVIWVVVLFVVAANFPGFVEKYVPGLNRTLHSGEISEDADADFAGIRIRQDMDALEAPLQSQDWAGRRNEYLEREKYLTDLKEQDAKIQRAGTQERVQHSIADNCEQLALDEYLPALDDYTKAVENIFVVLKQTPTYTDEGAVSSGAAFAKKDGAIDRWNAYVDHRKAKGCK